MEDNIAFIVHEIAYTIIYTILQFDKKLKFCN